MGFKDFFKKKTGVSGTDEELKTYKKEREVKSDNLFWYNKGVELSDLGRNEEALEAYEKAIEIDPKYASAWNRKGICFSNLGRREEALKAYEKAIEIEPKERVFWYNKGYELSELGRNDEALEAHEKAIEIEPKYADAWNSKGICLSNLGRREEALKAYDRAIEIEPKNHLFWYNKGVEFENLGRREEALKAYDRAIEIELKYADAWNQKGICLSNLGRWEEALKAYDKAIEIDPDYYWAWFNKGNALNDLNRYEEALKALEKAIEIKPDNHEAWNCKGITLFNLNRKEEALLVFEKAIEIKPDYVDAWNWKGCVLNQIGRDKEALKVFEEAIEIQSDYVYAWNWKGYVLNILGRNEEALKAFEKAIEINPDEAAWIVRGNALRDLGRREEALQAYDKALKDYEKGIEINPNDPSKWNGKGNALRGLGLNEEALKAYDKAIEIKPYEWAWCNKGKALSNLGRNEEALAAFEKAIEIKPDFVDAWYNKGNTLFKLEKYEDAIKCYNRVKEIDPEARNLQERLADATTRYREAALETLKFEIEDAGKYVYVPDVIKEVAEKGFFHKVDFARESLKKLISEAKPILSVELLETSLNLNEWYKSRIKISNAGNSHAFDVVLSFSDDFEVRRIEPVSIDAGDKKDLEIAMKPVVRGTVPLEITAKYGDGKGQSYESKHAFWIEVKEFQELKKPKEIKTSAPTALGAVIAVPRSFPEELIAKYNCIEYIGGGAFAKVFKAKREDEKLVAIKLPSSLDSVTGKSFISEIINWTGLEHENIVKVHDFNILPTPYFEMELCDCSLSEKQFPLGTNSSSWIIFNICDGLKYAHSKSIIHQDLKPQNILLKAGIPKISDWGLSKVTTNSGKTTSAGYTPFYAAPEQISKSFGKKSSRTDIWQVGVIFYEIVTGKIPFEGDDLITVMSGITMEEPEPPSSINPEAKILDPIIMKCLEKKQENRYQSVLELQNDLAKFLKVDYTESLRVSVSRNDMRRSAFYCGSLFIVHLKLGEMVTAYKYASDLLHYSEGETKVVLNELCTQLEMRIDSGINVVPDELMKKAEFVTHKAGLGFRK